MSREDFCYLMIVFCLFLVSLLGCMVIVLIFNQPLDIAVGANIVCWLVIYGLGSFLRRKGL